MLQHITPPSYVLFFDQVLAKIEQGNVEQGITLLAGMLDAVAMQAGQLESAQHDLARHTLHELLLEDPLCGYAARYPNDYSGLLARITAPEREETISPTGRRLFDVTQHLPIIRALHERAANADLKLHRAWAQGLRICILATADMAALPVLNGRDQSNITVIHYAPGKRHHFSHSAYAAFDLVCAFNICDQLTSAELPAFLAVVHACLAPQGSALLSALLPCHLGTGWRKACLHWDAATHDEAALNCACANAGLTGPSYRDATECITWSELRHIQKPEENKKPGYTKGQTHAG